MKPSKAFEVLHAYASARGQLRAAFLSAQETRRTWPIADPLGFCDSLVHGQPVLPSQFDWEPEVDVMSRPKQGGGTRLELLPDIYTGTVLQAVADELAELCERQSGNAPAARAGEEAESYDAWAALVTTWVRQELAEGRSVVAVDFAEFFPSIRREQLYSAMIEAGLTADIAQAAGVILEQINRSAGNPDPLPVGLPMAPDPLIRTLADLVLRPFDRAIKGIKSVRNLARWVDDCFLSCEAGEVESVIAKASDAAASHGFRLNPKKTRVLSSLEDYRAEFLHPENESISDLFLIASRQPGELELDPLLPTLLRRVESGGTTQTRILKRLYRLAAMVASPALTGRAERDLAGFPGAERQILKYLATLDWPAPSASILINIFTEASYDSTQLFALRLLLQGPPNTVPAAAYPLCARMASGVVPCHEFARALAFTLLACSPSGPPPTVSRSFSEALPGFRSAMARRVGLQSLLACGQYTWASVHRFEADPSPLVRRFAQIKSSPVDCRSLSAPVSDGPGFAWGALESLLRGQLAEATNA